MTAPMGELPASVGARLHSDTMIVDPPVDLVALAGACPDEPVFYWENPSRGFAIAALGAVREIRAAGPERFTAASAAARALLRSMEALGPDTDRPLVVGGFGFSDDAPVQERWREFPPARLVLPRLLWVLEDGRCRLTRTWEGGAERALAELEARAGCREIDASPRAAVASPRPTAGATDSASDEERRRWFARVEAVRALIAGRAATKVVIAREHELRSEPAVAPAELVAAARAMRPACFTFWVRPGAGASFVGSTPELLVRVTGTRVESGALAGSAPRGATHDEDRALGEALRVCPKNGREHALVVAAVRSALERVAAPVVARETPELLLLPEAQHLYTPIRGELATRRSAIEIAGLLHPTPAVCGVPREAARRLIERDEPGRGWYAGAVGWMDARGDGELAVALRSALVDGARVSLWAGAGIVEGSDAEAELAETEAKMMALFHGLPGKLDARTA